MAASIAQDLQVTGAFVDLAVTAGFTGLASVSSYVQNLGPGPVRVNWSPSATAPVGGGAVLAAGQTTYGTAAHIWAKSIDGNPATLTAGTTD